ncbi:hypothetical protein [Nonomuraea cavernae]|uniref:hypothetical protein n=1 Tax=Nonomuraea cavernae TaxID=2045107 RepID=UPI0033E1FADB
MKSKIRARRWGVAAVGLLSALMLASPPSTASSRPSVAPLDDAPGAADFNPNPTIGGNGNAVPAPGFASGARGVYAPSYLPGCPYQRVCVAVLDYQNGHNTWKIWNLYECGEYSLYDWHRRGWIRNNQSGSAVTYRLDSNHFPLSPSHPVNNKWVEVDWEPTWHIRTC